MLKNDLETQNFEIFDKVVHNFGNSKSDDDTKIGYVVLWLILKTYLERFRMFK